MSTGSSYTFDGSAPGMDAVNQANWYFATGLDTLELTSVAQLAPATGVTSHVSGETTLLGVSCTVEVISSSAGTVLAATPAAVGAAWPLASAFPALARDPVDDDTPAPLLRRVSLSSPILLYSTSDLPDLRDQLSAWTTWSTANANAFDDAGFVMYGTPDVSGAWQKLNSLLGESLPLALARLRFQSDDAAAPQPTLLPTLEVAIGTSGPLTLGPFSLASASLTIEAPLFDSYLADRVVLAASLAIEEHAFSFSAELPLGDGEIVLTGTLNPSGAALMDAGTADLLPGLGSAGLSAELHLTVASGSVSTTRLLIALTATDWELLTGIATLERASFTIDVEDPLGTPLTSVDADAGVTLLGRSIDITGTLPDGPVVGRSARGAALTLSGLVTQLGGDATVLGGTDFSLDELRFTHPVVTEDWELLATASGSLSVGSGAVPVDLRELRFRLMGPSPVGVALDAQLGIGTDLSVAVSATCTSTGWTFEGFTAPGQTVPVGELVNHLTTYVTGFSLPDVIASATLANLRVAYDSTASLEFAGELDLTVGDTDVHAGLDVTVTHGATQEIAVNATLLIGGQRFSVGAQQPDPTTKVPAMIVGAYAPVAGANGPDLRSLAAAISPPMAEILPSVVVQDALLAVAESVAPSTGTRYLFGTDLVIDAAVNAGDVGLGVLSDLIGADLGLSLTQGRVIVASDPFTGDECARITQLVVANQGVPVTLPTDGVGRALLAATLGICGTDVALELPIAAPGTHTATEPAITSTATTVSTTPVTTSAALTPATTSTPAPPAGAGTVVPAVDGTTWYPVERSFGPVTVHRVGARYEDGRLTLALGISVDVRGLTLGLDGLSVTSPIRSFDPSFGLTGLTIAYTTPSVAISGGLLRVADVNGVRFDGQALLSTSAFTVGALGSYTTVAGNPSLFVFALLQRDLGGPAAFFVTGLAAGFGFNRRLNLPSIDQVPSFPLVAMATGTRSAPASPGAALAALGSAVQPAVGEYWLAAGVRFTSFQIVKSFALVSVAFGGSTRIGLIGESRLTMPPEPGAGREPVAFARLAQRVSFEPDRGVLEVAAQLTPDSYILSRDCHLSGGFAFYTWFKDQADGARAGDFALTLGGYHPRFVRPAHYPTVAPIGFRWQIGDLTLSGRAYFALTPSVVMAGGALSAVWESGDIRAWFNAQTDFLLAWKPFRYAVEMHVSIGASFTVDLWLTSFTMRISVGVDLELWGPSFGGRAEIDVSVISFTIGFGAGRPGSAEAISWQGFRDSFLPAVGTAAAPQAALPAGIGPAPNWTGSYVSVRIGAGLERDLGGVLVVNGFEVEIVTDTQIPATQARFSHDDPAGGAAWTPDATVPAVEIGPTWLDKTRLVSEHVVVVRRLDPVTGSPQTEFDFFNAVTVQSRRAGVPRATWSVDAARSTGPGALGRINTENTSGGTGPIITGALVGFTFTGSSTTQGTPVAAYVDTLQQGITDSPSTPNWCPDAGSIAGGQPPDTPAPSFTAMASTMASAQGMRAQVITALGGLVTLDPDDRASAIPSDLGYVLQDVPAFIGLGWPSPLGGLA